MQKKQFKRFGTLSRDAEHGWLDSGVEYTILTFGNYKAVCFRDTADSAKNFFKGQKAVFTLTDNNEQYKLCVGWRLVK